MNFASINFDEDKADDVPEEDDKEVMLTEFLGFDALRGGEVNLPSIAVDNRSSRSFASSLPSWPPSFS